MSRILKNSSGQGINYNEFKTNFIEICNNHKDDDIALVFAIIIYNESNPEISKILKDTDYWNSLDKLSGKYLTVFSIKKKSRRRLKGRTGFSINRRLDLGSQILRPSSYGIPINTFSNLEDTNKDLLSELFGVNGEFPTPSILFFQIKDNMVLKSFFISLIEDKIEESYLEIKRYLTRAVDTLKPIKDENKGNSKELFDLIETDLLQSSRYYNIGKKISQIIQLSDLLGVFKLK